ncbi:DUF3164 family protein, partial [Shewanella sp. 1180_01]
MNTQELTHNHTAIPQGYRKNAVGDLVHEDRIKPVDKLRDEVVLAIVGSAKELREQMLNFKLMT